jgi:hypothetical protein
MGPICGASSGGSFTVGFKRKVRFYFIRRPCFLRGLQKMCKRRFWKQASLFTEAPLGNLVRGSFTWDCRDR